MRLSSLKYKEFTQRELYLIQLGGRRRSDVQRDEKGEFVALWDGKKHDYVKSYLPAFTDEWPATHL